MRTDDFDYHLPADLIAQYPTPTRDSSRLMVVDRFSRKVQHQRFRDLTTFLNPGDLLVLNNSKVIPARLQAFKSGTGGTVEVFLVEEITFNQCWAMLKPGKRARRGTMLIFNQLDGSPSQVRAEVLEKSEEGHYRLQFSGVSDLKNALAELGEIPLPPYIQRPSGPETADPERYQTVFAKPPGSVAAPTAGLHFTPHLLHEIRQSGINTAEVTLHVGLGTFAPVKVDSLEAHKMHEERYEISPGAAVTINETKSRGGRVIAVGTTSLRVLESVARDGAIHARAGKTRLFVFPPYNFQIVDALLTNFHLPKSTLLMLVSAFASPGKTDGVQFIRSAYEEAVRERYRFFSYGDAMLIL
jgi:S-adenosylmethionine:tRNA ribosyltransferase-isomerase